VEIGLLLILMMFGFLGMQLYSWATSSNASLTGLVASGISGGIMGWIVDSYTRGSVVISACASGIYGVNGYFLIFSMILLGLVFLSNALSDLTKNRPISLIH